MIKPRLHLTAAHLCRNFLLSTVVSAVLLFWSGRLAEAAATAAPERWWPETVEQALAKAQTNRVEITKALLKTPELQRAGMQFLLENMPEVDLKTLSASFLIENSFLAHAAFAKAPWRDRIPNDIFLNDILPYACVNETRDEWRKMFMEKCEPLVAGCRTPAEAAQRVNQKIFNLVKVHYSTQRKRADQSPLESMESGKATCTGLSILLIDACRAVGIPARLAGTPMWTNMRGNHTWVEIWDGEWHYTGADEPDPNGLDRGWFGHDASLARNDAPEHAIYASSFKQTGLAFPMVWARDIKWVSAVNVTDRYTAGSKAAPKDRPRLLVKVLDHPEGKRVAAKVTVTEVGEAKPKFTGTSKDESADLNDILAFEPERERSYSIQVERDGRTLRREFRPGTNLQEVVVLCLSSIVTPLKPREATNLHNALVEFFSAPTNRQAVWKFSRSVEKLLLKNEPAVRRAAWDAYRAAPIHGALRGEFEAKQVRFESHLSPYTIKTVGVRPPNGWALFIAMHGGGGAPKEVNDSQWGIMQRYYRDHPEAGGYLYLALRAPDDSWNGFYTDYIYPLVANLLREFLLFGDVDPNKVFIMGYSHGGYGAFAIGPKMPDRFAAIHASAAAPTDGETTARTLRNTIFTYMVGEKDTAYGRIDRCRKFNEIVQGLRGERKDIYPVTMEYIVGNGHTGLPDRDKIHDMYPAVRQPAPRELTWLMTDKVLQDFFWLHIPAPAKGQEVEAACQANRLTVTTRNVPSATVLLDSRLIDFKKPLTLVLNGATSKPKLQPNLRVLCETMQRRGDPELAFTASFDLPIKAAAASASAKR